MTRHRRSRSWWPKRRTVAAPEDAVTEPNDLNELAKAGRILDAGVAAHRQKQPDVQWYRDVLGRVTVPPLPAPGGA